MRFIFDKHLSAKILSLKTLISNPNINPIISPFNILKELLNKQLRRISYSSSTLILNLI
jgi:hypothetical protein